MAEERENTSDEREPIAAPAPAGAGVAAQVRPGDPQHAAYPLDQAQYWRESHASEPYYEAGRGFEDYSTAYELGWVSYHLYGGEFATAERVLANDWLVRKGVSKLSWEQARPAVRAAWQRAHNARSFASDGSAAPEQVLAALTDLSESARDGELGFREAATHARSPELAALFEQLAQRCGASAAAWQDRIAALGGSADGGGTVAGTAQRVWLQVRGLFGGAGEHTLLHECERGQGDIVQHLGEALARNLPLDLHEAVQREYEVAQRQLDHIAALRERGSAAPLDREVATSS